MQPSFFYEYSTCHPHQLTPCGFGIAHHPTSSLICCLQHPHSPGGTTVEPDLEDTYHVWIHYLRRHMEALIPHRQYTLELQSTLHPPFPAHSRQPQEEEQKCSAEGIRLCVRLQPSTWCTDRDSLINSSFGFNPGQILDASTELVCAVDIGRVFSRVNQTGKINFQLYVQVFLTSSHSHKKRAISMNISDVNSSRQSFPLACLLRYRLAQLIDDSPLFFPGAARLLAAPIHSFPSCVLALDEVVKLQQQHQDDQQDDIHTLTSSVGRPALTWSSCSISSYMSKQHQHRHQHHLSRQMHTPPPTTLITRLSTFLPFNPFTCLMKQIQSILYSAGQDCIICGYRIPNTLGQILQYYCAQSLCQHAFLTSPFRIPLVYTFIQTQGELLDLYLNILASAAGDGSAAVPHTVCYRDDFNTEYHIAMDHQVSNTLDLLPCIAELRLYDQDELIQQLHSINRLLVPLLAWLVTKYTARMYRLPLDQHVGGSVCVQQWIVLTGGSTGTLTPAFYHHVEALLQQCQQHQQHAERTGGTGFGRQPATPTASLMPVPLYVLHSWLSGAPIVHPWVFRDTDQWASSWRQSQSRLWGDSRPALPAEFNEEERYFAPRFSSCIANTESDLLHGKRWTHSAANDDQHRYYCVCLIERMSRQALGREIQQQTQQHSDTETVNIGSSGSRNSSCSRAGTDDSVPTARCLASVTGLAADFDMENFGANRSHLMPVQHNISVLRALFLIAGNNAAETSAQRAHNTEQGATRQNQRQHHRARTPLSQAEEDDTEDDEVADDFDNESTRESPHGQHEDDDDCCDGEVEFDVHDVD